MKRRHQPRILLLLIVVLAAIHLLRQVACVTYLDGIVTAVSDGQTLVVGDTDVRLNEIVLAPKRARARDAAWHRLRSLALGRQVACRICRRGGPQAPAAGRCQLADGLDLGQALIAAGLARDCVAVSGGRLAAFEVDASREIPLPNHCLPWLRRGPMPPLR